MRGPLAAGAGTLLVAMTTGATAAAAATARRRSVRIDGAGMVSRVPVGPGIETSRGLRYGRRLGAGAVAAGS
jgi:hypothetical protein